MPTRDRAHLLLRTLATAFAQEDVHLEVLVVDDGSGDGTAERLMQLDEPRLRYLRNETPRGAAAARNAGIAEARGAWIAFLDDDDLWAPAKLRTQLAAVAESDGVLCYTGSLYVDAAARPLRLRRTPHPAELRPGILRTNLIGGPSTVVVWADALRAVGGFDERLDVLADWDLWIRLLEHGPAVVAPEVLVGYSVHPGNMHSTRAAHIRGELTYLRGKHRELSERERTPVGGPDFSLWLVSRYRDGGLRADAAREYLGLALRRRNLRHLARAGAMLVRREIGRSQPPAELDPGTFPWLALHRPPPPATSPRVSVVVTARNEERRLPILLEALRRQSLPAEEYELIVVDDGSTDATAALAAAEPSVTLVRAPGHVGLAAGRNLGVHAARAPVVAFTDADCRPAPDWLELGLAAFERAGADILGGGITIAIERPTLSALLDAANHLDQESYIRRGFAAGANLWLRRSLVLELGGFDERLGPYGEEEEFCQRAVRSGAHIAYAPEAHVDHPARETARAVARKSFQLGAGLAAHRRFNAGTLGSTRRLFAASQLAPRRRVHGLDRLRRRGTHLSRPRVAALYLAQHLLIVLPKIAGDATGELRLALRHRPAPGPAPVEPSLDAELIRIAHDERVTRERA